MSRKIFKKKSIKINRKGLQGILFRFKFATIKNGPFVYRLGR